MKHMYVYCLYDERRSPLHRTVAQQKNDNSKFKLKQIDVVGNVRFAEASLI